MNTTHVSTTQLLDVVQDMRSDMVSAAFQTEGVMSRKEGKDFVNGQ